MTEVFSLILLALMCVLLKMWLSRNQIYSGFPQGPSGLPVVGYMPFLTTKPHLKFQELSKRYGNIFSFQLASWHVVVLNTAELIREAFSKPELLGRPQKSIFSLVTVESPFFSNGEIWQEQRQFSVQVLRNLGLGKSSLHEKIKDEIFTLIKTIKKGNAYDIGKLLAPSVSNNICSLVFGERYEYDDPQRLLLDSAIAEGNKYVGQTSLFVFFPWLRKLPFLSRWLKLDRVIHAFDLFHGFARKKIKQHKELLDPAGLYDFIDHYLYAMEAKLAAGKKTTFTDDLLLGSVVALFGGGSTTVHSALSWCFYVMAAYPEVQKKVQEEIDVVIGNEQTPNFSDLKNMPYTQSVLMEIQRWKTTLPLGVIRMAVDDCTIHDYKIPQNTAVIANLWAVHHSPDYWDHPDDFIPNRFLQQDGRSVRKFENYIPFSYGKRSCPGEALATVEIFLYFTSILQKFTLSVPEGQSLDLEGTLALTYQPKDQFIYFLPK